MVISYETDHLLGRCLNMRLRTIDISGKLLGQQLALKYEASNSFHLPLLYIPVAQIADAFYRELDQQMFLSCDSLGILDNAASDLNLVDYRHSHATPYCISHYMT